MKHCFLKQWLLGTFSNERDSNENVKKDNRFIKQNNNFARAAHFFVHFFTITSYMTVTWKYLISCFMGGCEQAASDDKFFFLFLNLSAGPKKSTLGEWICLQLTFSTN